MKQFAPGFLIGAATAAHQVEGNNTHNDCWAQEQMEHSSYVEPSLDACDHYHKYAEDITAFPLNGPASSRRRAALTRRNWNTTGM